MKKYSSVIILLFTFASCSSSVRFSNDETETANTESGIEEYPENYSVLESTTGVASYYADKFHGRKTASGEIYDMNKLSAAHSTYPFGTLIRVTNLKNNLSVVLKINDRQPGFKGRIIDLSLKAAEKLNMLKSGITDVKIEVLKWGDG
jgi:rare lipoprotein A